MRQVLHTSPCLVEGYSSLDMTHNLGMTGDELIAARAEGNLAPALADLPNWEAEAERLGLPKEKPAFPLTVAGINSLPMILQRYFCDNGAISDALDHALAARSPNSRRN